MIRVFNPISIKKKQIDLLLFNYSSLKIKIMESLLSTMSGIGILIGIGYLILSIFMIVYFFRMANDVKDLKESLHIIKRLLVDENRKAYNEAENSKPVENLTKKEDSFIETYTRISMVLWVTRKKKRTKSHSTNSFP
jgi:hypothetical protein